MRSRWQIACYKTPTGDVPVVDYMFDGKNETDLAVMIGDIQRLSRVGQMLLETDAAKPIEGPIFELRPNRHRILYAEDKGNNRFVLLCAFLKSTQKTPIGVIEEAQQYWADYLRTGNCELFTIPFDE